MKNNVLLSSLIETIHKHKFSTILLGITIVITALLQIMPSYLLKYIIDDYIVKQAGSGLLLMATLYLLILFMNSLFGFLREILIAKFGQTILVNLKLNMARKMSRMPMAYFSGHTIGSIMSYFTSDVDAIAILFQTGLIGMTIDVLKAIGIIISIYLLDPTISIYVMLLVPILLLMMKLFNDKTFKAQKRVRTSISRINSSIQELFSNIRTIKFYQKEKIFLHRMEDPLEENVLSKNGTSFLDALYPCILQLLKALVITVTVLLFTSGLGSSILEVGLIVALVDLITKLFSPLEAISMEFQTIQEARSGMKRIEQFMDEPEENRIYGKEEIQDHSIVKAENVSFSYDSTRKIIKNISFTLEKGQNLVIIGRTGAGKSTILNLIDGLYQPTEGRILLNGKNPYTMPPNERRHIIGVVPQNLTKQEGTIRDMITLYDTNITDKQIEEVLRIVDLEKEINALPNGYNTVIGEGEVNLSKGEIQLLSLACAIVCKPPILLLDEFTSGMDVLTEEKVLNVIRKISSKMTIITISHRLSNAIEADVIMVVEQGKLIEYGSKKELIEKNGWYAKYLQMNQFGWNING